MERAEFVSRMGAEIAAKKLSVTLGKGAVSVFPRIKRGEITGFHAGVMVDGTFRPVTERFLERGVV